MLTLPYTSRKTGGFVFVFSKPVPTIMDSFAPEVTVESLYFNKLTFYVCGSVTFLFMYHVGAYL